ncbi:hypothetical protein A3F59_06395 [Candidatus Roizmanbacteria bacterium RIFCSPHIGHO2_12_FULL_38_13]|nr:MAG: hypothetical protein A2684_00030 [Candidatus Levybacteria bacterium RIFCSPHIGHO2_01_FULL_36_15b]OGK34641.1 MAG: hypothetical protein A3F59_06395 [Candidatus Roizmanbacteria bacterium RIFCSPHIGHO2_12_FULL_38_13]
MSEQEGIKPQEVQTQEEEILAEPKKKAPSMSRRKFLQLALASTATVIGAKSFQVLNDHPEFVDKTARSLQSGKIIEDVKQVVESQLRIGNGEITLRVPEVSKYQQEEWMPEVSDSVQILEAVKGKRQFPLLFFDVTNSVSVVGAEKKQGKHNGLDVLFYDLAKPLNQKRSLVLPRPQYQLPNMPGVKAVYAQYKMYAWADGHKETESQLPYSGNRGGMVLTKNRGLVVATPEEFSAYHASSVKAPGHAGVQALMEFGFVIDSVDVEGSFKALEGASPILKDLVYSVENMNGLFTIHYPDGSHKTYLLAAYEPNLSVSFLDPESQISGMNLIQLTQVVDQFRKQSGGDRFTIAITDPSDVASNCYTPMSLSKEELDLKGFPYAKNTFNPSLMKDLEIEEKYFRTIGSPDNFTFPENSFPWVLASQKI